jgi:DNA helicase INO80
MEVPQLHKLILDSGKLAKLDELLTQLKAGGHRVLVYFQMTRMIDLMEEYLAFRQHKYLRLDGSSSISERRDMVGDWQSKPEIFIFLLSTRAGGLGINLTAADTVVFYDSDWNPSNDSQAMDRAHRLGQQRQVTVYRLITKNTIDERILALARNKKVVQDAVVGSSTQVVGGSSGEVKGNEVVNLLLDDDELAETLQQSEAMKENKGRAKDIAASARSNGRNASSSGLGGAAAGHGWDNQDEDDDAFGFFSNTTNKPSRDPDDDGDLGGGDGEGQGDAGDAGGAKGKGKGKAKAPRAPAKPRARKPKEPEDPNAPPKKRARAPKKKEEPEIGPDGQPIIPEKNPRGGWPKGKPRGKKLAITPNTVGSSNPAFDTEGSLNTSAAQTPMHLD